MEKSLKYFETLSSFHIKYPHKVLWNKDIDFEAVVRVTSNMKTGNWIFGSR